MLQEHDRALGGPQEQHCVDLGDVEAFVEQIHGKQDLQLAGAQAADLLGALLAGAGGNRYAEAVGYVAAARRPAATNLRAIQWACSTLTQKPRARIASRLVTLSASSRRIRRRRASSAV